MLSELKEMLAEKRLDYTQTVAMLKEEKSRLEKAYIKLENVEKSRVIIQEVAQRIQAEAIGQITSIVSKGLQTVFDEPYTFKINFEKKRGRTEASMVFERDGLELDPLSASGGGVIDVAAFTLRIACLVLSRPSVRPLLILDEPFKHVSAANGYLEKVPVLLESLAEDFGIQIIMVTHIDELKVGKIIEVGSLHKV